MAAENQTQTSLDEKIASITADVDRIVNSYEQEIDELKSELAQLQALTKGMTMPDYGTLPVSPQVHEAIVDIARSRDIAPGVLMLSENVTNHLMKLVHMEII